MNTKQMKKEAAVHGRLMPPLAAGDYLGGIAVQTLAKWRCQGTGPEFVRIGDRIMYETGALDTFIASRRRRSTSEAA